MKFERSLAKRAQISSDRKSHKAERLPDDLSPIVLEPRVLFDAAAVFAIQDHILDYDETTDDIILPVAALEIEEEVGTEIVFIDSAVGDISQLGDAIPTTAEVVIIDGQSDGLDQIASYLSDKSDISAVHIISHGSSGQLSLGSTDVTLDNIDDYSQQLFLLGDAMTPNGDLFLYGCSVGAGEDGATFVEEIAHFTGADVAASTDLTGDQAKGGDWDLELKLGDFETSTIQALDFDGTLDQDVNFSYSVPKTIPWAGDAIVDRIGSVYSQVNPSVVYYDVDLPGSGDIKVEILARDVVPANHNLKDPYFNHFSYGAIYHQLNDNKPWRNYNSLALLELHNFNDPDGNVLDLSFRQNDVTTYSNSGTIEQFVPVIGGKWNVDTRFTTTSRVLTDVPMGDFDIKIQNNDYIRWEDIATPIKVFGATVGYSLPFTMDYNYQRALIFDVTVTGKLNAVAEFDPQTDDLLSTGMGTSISGQVAGRDGGILDEIVTLTISEGPKNGTLSGIDYTTGATNFIDNYTYTPDENFTGVDTITFALDDGIDTTYHTVEIVVEPPRSIGIRPHAGGTFGFGDAIQPAAGIAVDDVAQITLSVDAGTLNAVAAAGITITPHSATELMLEGRPADLATYLAGLNLSYTSAAGAAGLHVADLTVSNLQNITLSLSGIERKLAQFQMDIITQTSVSEGSSVIVAPDLVLPDDYDADTLINTARVLIDPSRFQNGDVLSAQNLPAGTDITASYDADLGVLTLNSAVGQTQATWQSALRTVTFLTSNDNPQVNKRVDFVLGDQLYLQLDADGDGVNEHHFYDIRTDKQNWDDAQVSAKLTTLAGSWGSLATVTTQAERDFLDSHVSVEAYLAGYDPNGNNSWIWADGLERDQAVAYDNWASGEPNNIGRENAMTLRPDGLWNNIPQTDEREFVVEYSPNDGNPIRTSVDVQVQPTNDIPINIGETFDYFVANDNGPTAINLTQIEFFDPDFSAADQDQSDITLHLETDVGSVSVVASNGISIVGNNSNDVKITGSIADMNAYLQQVGNVKYTAPAVVVGHIGIDTLRLSSQGATQVVDGVETSLATIDIDLRKTKAALEQQVVTVFPDLDLDGYAEDLQTNTAFALISPESFETGDVLGLSTTPAGLTVTYDDSLGVLLLETAELKDVDYWQDTLRKITYSSDIDNPVETARQIDVILGDYAHLRADQDGDGIAEDHFYTVLPGTYTLDTALSTADQQLLSGMSGYLATVTSAAENTVIKNLISSSTWLGASDEATEGTFEWLVGPEAGQPISYTRWASGEPNNSGGNEDGLLMRADGPWNDDTTSKSFGAVVEYNTGALQHIRHSARIDLTAVNDAPDGDASKLIASISMDEDTSEAFRLGALDLFDPDTPTDPNAMISVTVDMPYGAITAPEASGITIAQNSSQQVMFSGTAADLNAYFSTQDLTYTPQENQFTGADFNDTKNEYDVAPFDISVVLSDGTDTRTLGTIDVAIAPVADVPDISVASSSGPNSYFIKGSNGVSIVPKVSFTDGDGLVEVVSIVISSDTLKSSDSLSFVNDPETMGNITADTYDSSTGRLTLRSANGDATTAQWEAAMEAVKFKTTDYTDLSRDIEIIAGDAVALTIDGEKHFYEYINVSKTWHGARDIAQSKNFYGLSGYLATITSEAENEFITDKLKADAWVGGRAYQTSDGWANWIWDDGPEAGDLFFRSKITFKDPNFWNGYDDGIKNREYQYQTGKFTNWYSGEPNDGGYAGNSRERYLQIYSARTDAQGATWNDYNSGRQFGVVVEYDTSGSTANFADTVKLAIVDPNNAPTFDEGVVLNAVDEDATNPSGARVDALLADKFSDTDATANGFAGIAISADYSTADQGQWEYSVDNGASWVAVRDANPTATNALLLNKTASLRFTPTANYSGTPGALDIHAVEDSRPITFTSGNGVTGFDTILDDFTSSVSASTVTLSTAVSAVNDAPNVMMAAAPALNEGASVLISSDYLLETDPDHDGADVLYELLSVPSFGVLKFDSDADGEFDDEQNLSVNATFTQADINSGRVLYQHDGSENHADSLNFELSDGSLVSGSKTLNINVQSVNDVPAFVTTGLANLSVTEGGRGSFSGQMIKANDADNTANELTFQISKNVEFGRLWLDVDGDATKDADEAWLSVNSSFTLADINAGRLQYEHDGSENHVDTFTINLTDAQGASAAQATTFEILATPVNDAPELAALNDLTLIDTQTSDYFEPITGKLDFTDVDGDPLDFILAEGQNSLETIDGTDFTHKKQTPLGLFRLNAQSGEWRFDADASSVDALVNDATTQITLTANDGLATSAQRTLTIAAKAANDAPAMRYASQYFVSEGTASTISATHIEARDTDNSADELTYTVFSETENGIIWLDTDQSGALDNGEVALGENSTFTQADIDNNILKYRHNGSETLTDVLAFSVKDTAGLSSNSALFVNVTPVNDAPTYTPPNESMAYSLMRGSALNIDMSPYFSDVDVNDNLSFYSVSADDLRALDRDQGLPDYLLNDPDYGLPDGLSLDNNSGLISGKLNRAGTTSTYIIAQDQFNSWVIADTIDFQIIAPPTVVETSSTSTTSLASSTAMSAGVSNVSNTIGANTSSFANTNVATTVNFGTSVGLASSIPTSAPPIQSLTSTAPVSGTVTADVSATVGQVGQASQVNVSATATAEASTSPSDTQSGDVGTTSVDTAASNVEVGQTQLEQTVQGEGDAAQPTAVAEAVSDTSSQTNDVDAQEPSSDGDAGDTDATLTAEADAAAEGADAEGEAEAELAEADQEEQSSEDAAEGDDAEAQETAAANTESSENANESSASASSAAGSVDAESSDATSETTTASATQLTTTSGQFAVSGVQPESFVADGQSITFKLPFDAATVVPPNFGEGFASRPGGAMAGMSVTAQQADGNPLPDWMTFNSNDLTFAGSVPPGVTGQFEFVVQAKNNFGQTKSVTITFDVGAGSATADDGAALDEDILPNSLIEGEAFNRLAQVDGTAHTLPIQNSGIAISDNFVGSDVDMGSDVEKVAHIDWAEIQQLLKNPTASPAGEMTHLGFKEQLFAQTGELQTQAAQL